MIPSTLSPHFDHVIDYCDITPGKSFKIPLKRLPNDRIVTCPIKVDHSTLDTLPSNDKTLENLMQSMVHRLAAELRIPANRVDIISQQHGISLSSADEFWLLAHLTENRVLTESDALSFYTNPPKPSPSISIPEFIDI